MDLAVTVAGEGAVDILYGDGNGGFTKGPRLPAGINPHGIVSGDFNGDGFDDLAVSNRTSRNIMVYLGDGKGGFSPQSPFRTNEDVITLAAGDFNGDGKADLALISASTNQVLLLLGNGHGQFSPWTGTNEPAQPPRAFARPSRKFLRTITDSAVQSATQIPGAGDCTVARLVACLLRLRRGFGSGFPLFGGAHMPEHGQQGDIVRNLQGASEQQRPRKSR
jgi:hypothetical protein